MSLITFVNDSKIAKAESINPFQTVVEFIFTDFLPNKNKQGIPVEETDNIINTAIGMPVKISFAAQKGHSGAIPVGPIQAVWRGVDGEREVLYARAAIWDREYPDVADYVKTAYAEDRTIGTSWEIKYEKADVIDGVEWLRNTVCVGTAIVDKPAYGETRTRILAVAENMEEERTAISQLQEQIASIYKKLNEMYYNTYLIEEAEATDIGSLDEFMDKFTKLAETLDARAKSAGVALADAQAALENANAAATTNETAVAELNEKITTLTDDLTFARRSTQLIGVFSADELEAKRTFILKQDDTAFAEYVADLRKVAKAEENTAPKYPNFVGRKDRTLDEIVESLKEGKK